MRKWHGFSLIEILVVILIISITLGFAMLAYGDFGEKRSIVTAAQEFANYVTLVKQEAILESSTLGIHTDSTGYEALRFQEPKTWQPMAQSIFHHHRFPKRVVIHILPNRSQTKSPAIIVNASGDMTPFEIHFGTAKNANVVTVIGKSDGYVAVTTP
ncbi:MAG: type II secretion system minor pseudopilin GspH [Legionellaceae bacterium]|nr:type II secretion system minor pseudopilin GspH [Legionellaceae bacterium]